MEPAAMIGPVDALVFGPTEDLEIVGQSAQARVFRIPADTLAGYDDGAHVFKHYRSHVAESVEGSILDDLIAWRRELSDEQRQWLDARFCWPLERVAEGETTVGVVLPHVPPSFYAKTGEATVERKLDWIYLPDRAIGRQVAIPTMDRQLFHLFAHLAEGMAFLNSHLLNHTDISQRNVLWNDELHTYVIDCDGVALIGRSATPVLGTPDWIDPRVESGEIKVPDIQSDIRAFAVGLARCLAGQNLNIGDGLDIELLPEDTPGVVSRLLHDSVKADVESPSFDVWSLHLYEQADVVEQRDATPERESPPPEPPPVDPPPPVDLAEEPETPSAHLLVRLLDQVRSSRPQTLGVSALGCLLLGVLLWFTWPTGVITVDPEEDLAAILESLEGDGSVVELRPGEFQLTRSVQVAVPFSLRGAVGGDSIVDVTTAGAAMSVSGVAVEISGVAFSRGGIESAEPLLHFTNTELALSELDISRPGGPGILVDGSSTGTLRSVVVTASDSAGIVVAGTANLEIASTESSDNLGAGFDFTDQSRAQVVNSVAKANGLGEEETDLNGDGETGVSGFRVTGASEVNGVDLLSVGNTASGFEWRKNATGEITESNGDRNRKHGFAFFDTTEVDLTGNGATENQDTGYLWSGSAAGEIVRNTATANERYGFIVNTGTASLDIRENAAVGPSLAGFYWTSGGEVVALENSARDSGSGFVFAGDYVIRKFEDNEAYDNQQYGIRLTGSGTGSLLSNSVFSNGDDGIVIEDEVSVKLRNNFVFDNLGVGVDAALDSSTISAENSISDNRLGPVSN